MPATNRSALSSFDAALRAVRASASGTLYSFCECDTESFRPLYVDDRTLATYENTESTIDHFDRIHNRVDFVQTNRFRTALFPAAERVEYTTTSMDSLKILRFYVGDEGMVLAVDPDEPVVEAIERTVDWPPAVDA